MPKWQKMSKQNITVSKVMRNNLFPIAKEGWSYLGYAFVAFILFAIFDLDILELLAFAALLAFAFVFRNPERVLPVFEKESVVSPVDGVVVAIEELSEGEYAYKVEIEGSYMDVAVLRVPLTSEVSSFKVTRGTRLSKQNQLSRILNENAEVVFQDHNANTIKITHRAKQSFDPIKFDMFVTQKFAQGSRYGTALNATTLLYLPQNFRLNINVGTQVKASETLIGYFS